MPGGDIIKVRPVLVIERDEALAAKATVALEEAGYKVVRAVDALDGLRKLYEVDPGLIIVDSALRTASGEYAYLRMRQASYLPIIILGSQEEAVDMLELGADAYMTKPPGFDELVARVKSLLRRKLCDDSMRGQARTGDPERPD
ncbi:MAG: response regulator [Dehalococcoidia bacterium]|nr:MAG: response regulator [Dehalococcoidia bacterium]